MAAASRSLATALSEARFASGLLHRSYTTNRDRTWTSRLWKPLEERTCSKLQTMSSIKSRGAPIGHRSPVSQARQIEEWRPRVTTALPFGIRAASWLRSCVWGAARGRRWRQRRDR